MTRLLDATFESNALTGTNGVSATTGTWSVDNTSKIKDTYAAFCNGVVSSNLRINLTGSSTVFLSFYVMFGGFPVNGRFVYIQAAGGLMRLDVRTTGKVRLADGAGTQIGSDSTLTMSANTVYRIGLRYTKGAGTDATYEAFIAQGDDPFGSAFASTTTGTATSDVTRIDIGNTSSGTNWVVYVDNIHVDDTSMPAADGGAINTPKTITVTINAVEALGAFQIGKPINQSITTTPSLKKAVSKLISVVLSVLITYAKAKGIIATAIVGSVVSLGSKNIGKPITRAVSVVYSAVKGLNSSKLITYAVTTTVSVARGMVTQKVITLAISTVNTVRNNIGKPITRTINTVLTNNYNWPKSITVAIIPVVNIGRSIFKNITYTSVVNKTVVYGQMFYKNAVIVVTSSVNILKNIVKPVSLISTVTQVSARKAIGKTLNVAIGNVLTFISGKGYLKAINVISAVNVPTLSKTISKPITRVVTVVVNATKSFSFTITRVVSVVATGTKSFERIAAIISTVLTSYGRSFPRIITVTVQSTVQLLPKQIAKTLSVISNVNILGAKGYELAVSVLINISAGFTKLSGTINQYIQFKKNVRELTLGLKNSTLDALSKNKRTLSLRDTDNDNI